MLCIRHGRGLIKKKKEEGYMQKLYDRRSKSVIALATALVLTVSGIATGTDVNAASKKQPTLSKTKISLVKGSSTVVKIKKNKSVIVKKVT